MYPTKNTTYNLSAIKSGSTTQTRSLVVNVNNSSNYVCSINSFSVNESSVVVGGSVTFSWSTENCTSVNISNIGTNLPSTGEKTIYPTKTTTYTLTGNTSSGTKPTRSLSVSVSDSANYICSIINFGANDTSVTEGDAVTISWSTENCTSVNISNIGTNLPSTGEKTIYPTKTTTYTLTGNASSWTKPTRSLKINVSATPEYECSIVDFYAKDTSIEDGDKAVLVWNVEDCDYISISGIGTVSSSGTKSVYPSSDKTYTLTAYDSGKTKQTKNVKIYVDDDNNDDDDSDYCEIDSFTSSSSSISKGDGVTLKWRTTGCEDLSISNIGDVDEDDSYKVYPRVTTTYVLRAYGEDGDKETKSLTIRVGDSEEQTVYNVGTVTTIATGLTQNSASLNGLITGSTSSINSNAYFEYGTTTALGNRTKSVKVSGNANFSEYVSGLAPNTIYYFRAVSDNSGGTAYGAIQTFRTLGYNYNNNYTNTTTEVIRQVVVGGGTTVYGENSPVMLSIENRYEYLGRKDYIDYTVEYKNIGKATLEDVVLQVVVPEGIFITNASEGTYSNDTHILSVELDDLIPGEDGVVYLEARVDSLPDNLAKIVSSAVLVYTNKNGAQENAIAYVLNMPKTNVNNLGASAFFSGFWGFGLIGWLLIILLILLIILIARSIYQKRVSSEQNNN